MIKAIQTAYKGFRFRSRLEARWAVFFDAMGIKWEYEPEGFDLGEFGWYLPDFYLPQAIFHAEVKARWDDIPKKELDMMHHFDSEPPEGSFGLIFLVGIPSMWEPDEVCPLVPKYESSTWHVIARCVPENSQDERIRSAVLAARSARFEHGEKP